MFGKRKWCWLVGLLLLLPVRLATAAPVSITEVAQQDAIENQLAGYRLPKTATAAEKTTYQQVYAQCQAGYQTAARALTAKQALSKIAATVTADYRYGFQAAQTQFKTAFQAGEQAGSAGKPAVLPQELPLARTAYQQGYASGQAHRQATLQQAKKQTAVKKGPTASKKAKPQSKNPPAKPKQTPRHQQTNPPVKRQPAPKTAAQAPTPPDWQFTPSLPLPNQQAFVRQLAKSAVTIAPRYGLYASVMIAQAALESNWGRSQLAAPPCHNLFGVKGTYAGQTALWWTQEDLGKVNFATQRAAFKRYPNYQQALLDYARLLKGGLALAPHFYAGAWKQNAPTYQAATQFLTGRYATDRYYHLKLNQIIQTYQLIQYDQPQANQLPKKVNFTAKLKKQPAFSLTWAAYFKPVVPVIQFGASLPLWLPPQ